MNLIFYPKASLIDASTSSM